MKDFLRENGILLLVIAVLIAAILGVSSALLGFSPIANFIGIVATPFRAAVSSVSGWVEEQYDYAFRYEELVEENDTLKKRIAELEEEIRQAEDANRQNELFRELIGLAERRADFDFEDATVTARTVSNWNSTLTINKGTNVDIAVGDCVVDAYGNLVGVVAEVGFNYSVVATVVDVSIEMGGRISRTDDNAVLEGDFTLMREGCLKLAYLPENSPPLSGDRITTSGLGDVYPSGLVVGTIQSIHIEADGMNRYAVVAPSADLEGLRYVFVIKDFDVVR